MEFLVIVGVSEDCSAGHPDSVQILAKWIPHLSSVSPELVIIMEPVDLIKCSSKL